MFQKIVVGVQIKYTCQNVDNFEAESRVYESLLYYSLCTFVYA